jgi:small subunit ribosomal protein S21
MLFLSKKRRLTFFDLKKWKICIKVMKRTIFDELSILFFLWLLVISEKYRKGCFFMLKVKSRAGESVQQMIRRFKKLCEKEGLIRDMKRMAYYEKPSEKNRRRMRKAQRSVSLR